MFEKIKKIIKIGTDNDKNRVEWLRKTLKSIPSGLRILDAGAGEKRFKDFCSHLDYVSQDFAQYNGEGDKTGLQMGKWDQANLDIVSDITSMPEPDESFDAILCTEVFEHIPDPISAIKEFSRLLKRGGRLIITAPFCCGTHFAPYYFL
jgi:ubiquinone/menaquinone biosynthesis C-methylase UbiE